MNGYLNNGQILKPNEPLLKNVDGTIDEEKHPFIIIAQDDNACYGFHMTSGKFPPNIIGDLLHKTLHPNKEIAYNNKQISQNSYVRVDHIHRIKYNDALLSCQMYGFVKPNTKEIIDALIAKHLFLSDYDLTPQNKYTDKVLQLTGHLNMTDKQLKSNQNELLKKYLSDIRSSQAYQENFTIIKKPEFRALLADRISTVKKVNETRKSLLELQKKIDPNNLAAISSYIPPLPENFFDNLETKQRSK